MSTTTRLIATILIAASFGITLATGGAALFDRDASASAGARFDPTLQQVRATIRTDWLEPVSARRSLDERHGALERWVAERGGYVRVLDDASALRTRSDAGVRLNAPVAQLARTLVIFMPRQQPMADVVQALAGTNATVASVVVDAGAWQPTVEF
jgi:hypothetical protein